MAEVARRAGLAKGTVYLYHATKESLFLQLVIEALTRWFAEVEAALRGSGPRLGPDELATLLVEHADEARRADAAAAAAASGARGEHRRGAGAGVQAAARRADRGGGRAPRAPL
jgi:AcrR family transcriptional regulator